jgi:hypothetical protein
MSNPYTTRILSDIEYLSDGSTLQFAIEFTTAIEGTSSIINFSDHGIEIIDHGKVSWDYDYEERLLTPCSTKLKLADTEGYLYNLIFSTTTIGAATEKRFKVEILLNGGYQFSGYTLEDDVIYRTSEKTIEFSASPRSDILNNAGIYNNLGFPLDPIGYGSAGLNNYRSVLEIINDAFVLINPSIVGTINHDWLFKDSDGTENITIDSLFIKPSQFYDHPTWKAGSVGDILKTIAIGFHAKIGVISERRYFFEKLGYYSTSNTQPLLALEHEISLKYSIIKYLNLSCNIPDYGTYILEMPNSSYYTTMETARVYYDVPFIGIQGAGWNGNLLTHVAPIRFCWGAYDPNVWRDGNPFPDIFPLGAGYYNTHYAAGMSYWLYRKDPKNQIVHKFKCSGVTYEVDKTCLCDGAYYQVISMIKDWEKETTDIETIYCAAAT